MISCSNFQLEILIHEVKHLLRLKSESDLPASAVAFYKDRERLCQQRVMLRFVIERYNDLREDLLSIELPLLQPAFKKMDDLLAPGETGVLWSGDGKNVYVNELRVILRLR